MPSAKTTKKNDHKIIKVKVTKSKSATVKKAVAGRPVKILTESIVKPIVASKIITPILKPKISYSSFWQYAAWFTGVVVIFLLISTAMVATKPLLVSKPQSNQSAVNLPITPVVTEFFSSLTGEKVTQEVAERRPLAVVIENHPQSRPQSGLSFADLVWEAPTEGGITRFLAIFQKGLPARIGPVRSARPYFNDWAREVGGFYAHSGGSNDAIAEIDRGIAKVQDVNEFYNGDAYWRDASESKPHNLYTSADRFYSYVASKNWDSKNQLTDWLFKSPENKVLTGKEAGQVLVPYKPLDYDVLWKYDTEAMVYKRYMDGKPQQDRTTADTLQTKNLVVMFTAITPIPKDPLLHVKITTVGEGTAYLFTQGKVYEGKWQRDSLGANTKFIAADGVNLPFTPGNTWISVIDNSLLSELEYK